MLTEQDFQRRWPSWFDNVYCGFSCPQGWMELLWDTCLHIEKLRPGPEFKVAQVKEKFGGLRFYTDGASDAICRAIAAAETKSFSICQNCGGTQHVRTCGPGWVMTLCQCCRAQQDTVTVED